MNIDKNGEGRRERIGKINEKQKIKKKQKSSKIQKD